MNGALQAKYNYKKAYEAAKFSCRLFPVSEALLNNNQFRVSSCIFLQQYVNCRREKRERATYVP